MLKLLVCQNCTAQAACRIKIIKAYQPRAISRIRYPTHSIFQVSVCCPDAIPYHAGCAIDWTIIDKCVQKLRGPRIAVGSEKSGAIFNGGCVRISIVENYLNDMWVDR